LLEQALEANKSYDCNISTKQICKLVNKPQRTKWSAFADQCKVTQKLVNLTNQLEAFLESTDLQGWELNRKSVKEKKIERLTAYSKVFQIT
jgi:hypothetical protein